MICRHCGENYRLDWGQPAPGGSSSPGFFFWLAVFFLVCALILFAADLRGWAFTSLGVSIFIIIQVPIAYLDCTRGVYDGRGCPGCKTINDAHWWSL